MNIKAQDIGKKFGRNWIFRNLDFEIKSGEKVAITGKNGSGKSTLLQILSGYLTPSKGSIFYNENDTSEGVNAIFIGPYIEIIEEFTLIELLRFHSKFKEPLIPLEEMAKRASIPLGKRIDDFSTGMKQRAKLIIAFFFESELIFMDEPTSNLDAEGYDWWKKEINLTSGKTTIIASNQENEIAISSHLINL
ncbi:MAG: ATP-binding cassette domain-containing protein [Bacteroidota bacterium]